MTFLDGFQLLGYLALLLLLSPVLGFFFAKIFQGEPTAIEQTFGWAERGIYKLSGIDSNQEMTWLQYTGALLWFNFFGFAAVFFIQLFQSNLPLNPQNLPNIPWPLAFNTAVSFMTNTNWQAYAGETTLSYFVQMLGLTVQNFVSAGTGIAVFLSLTRGLIRKESFHIGNFWVDLTRSVLYVLFPLSILFALFLVGQGVIQTFSSYEEAIGVEGHKQVIALGPVASQLAIKQLGTNGGGFFNANSAHPFENPTPLTNFFEMLAILLIPAVLVYTFGFMTKQKKHAQILFATMLCFFLGALSLSLWSEFAGNSHLASGLLMEGKEVRFGTTNSVLWSVATTVASNGSVNAMHSSLTPLAGGIALFNIMLGEIIFGGVGAGMYGMILFVLLTVFLAGLMVGRTPEYLGKKIETKEMKWVLLAIVGPCAVILLGAGIASVIPDGLSSLSHKGPHGLSEILYAFTSAAGNNGSAFAGLNANTNFYNLALGISMLIGRFVVIVPALAVAGSLARKKYSPPSVGTFPTDTFTFGLLLAGVILIVSALTFFPSLTLGPIVEHFLMIHGRMF